MARSLEINQATTVGSATRVVAGMILLSRLTGFGRFVVTSYFYGRGDVTDAYVAAFNIPDTLAILISGGLLATGFVPVFTKLLTSGQEEEAKRTFRALLWLIIGGFGAISLGLLALTWTPLGRLLAPGHTPEDVTLYLRILRILLVAQWLFVVGGAFAGTFNALRRFLLFAVQPVLYNVGIMVFGILGGKFHWGIEAQAWGALIGAGVGTLGVMVPFALQNGLSLAPLWDIQNEGVRRVGASFAPIVLGLASGQIIALNLPRAFGKLVGAGGTTSLDAANRLMQVPLDLLASSAAVALLPTLSRLWIEDAVPDMKREFGLALKRNIRAMLFSCAMLLALAPSLVALALEHGKFGARDASETALVLRCYALCLPALGAQQLLARGFYATNQGREVVGIGALSMLLFFPLGFLGTRLPLPAGAGLALAAGASCSVLSGVLARKLWVQWGETFGANNLLPSVFRSLVIAGAAGVLSALVAYLAGGIEAPLAESNSSHLVKVVARAVVLSLGAGTGACVWKLLSPSPHTSTERNAHR